MAVPGKKSKKKDKRDIHGLELQAKTMSQAMIRQWLTVFHVPAVICSDRGTQFVVVVSHDVQVQGREARQGGGISQPFQRRSGGGGQAIVQNIPTIAYWGAG